MSSISKRAWTNYITALRKISDKAAAEMTTWVDIYGKGIDIADIIDPDGRDVVDAAYVIARKYGNASGALSAQMYDLVAELSGVPVDPAEIAELPTYSDVAKTVRGVLKTSQNPDELGGAVSRLAKKTGCDTTLKNAQRDGAYAAWVPSGDTCAFCIMLASRGWERSTGAKRSEHIHSNCDCTYAVRFGNDLNIPGYNPDAYYQQWKDAEGRTTEQKLNSMRRQYYAENREQILAQKADAYAKRMELNASTAEETDVN